MGRQRPSNIMLEKTLACEYLIDKTALACAKKKKHLINFAEDYLVNELFGVFVETYLELGKLYILSFTIEETDREKSLYFVDDPQPVMEYRGWFQFIQPDTYKRWGSSEPNIVFRKKFVLGLPKSYVAEGHIPVMKEGDDESEGYKISAKKELFIKFYRDDFERSKAYLISLDYEENPDLVGTAFKVFKYTLHTRRMFFSEPIH